MKARRTVASLASVTTLVAFAGCQSRITRGLVTPESALYDRTADVYLISNINGSPFGEDANGYVARFSPDGEIIATKWIDGASDEVTLNAPKGMALVDDTIWIADLDTVRRFDRTTGAPLGEVVIEGATFLNDVAAAPDGTIYVSDTGFGPGFTPTGTDAIYAISNDNVRTVAKGTDLSQPNGLLFHDGALLFVTWGSGELRRLKEDGSHELVTKLPKGQLDGIVKSDVDGFLVSSWEGKAVYRIGDDGDVSVEVGDLDEPADIGYDTKRDRILVPWFGMDWLEVVPD